MLQYIFTPKSDKHCDGQVYVGLEPVRAITGSSGQTFHVGGWPVYKRCTNPVSWFILADNYDRGHACNEHKLLTESDE